MGTTRRPVPDIVLVTEADHLISDMLVVLAGAGGTA